MGYWCGSSIAGVGNKGGKVFDCREVFGPFHHTRKIVFEFLDGKEPAAAIQIRRVGGITSQSPLKNVLFQLLVFSPDAVAFFTRQKGGAFPNLAFQVHEAFFV